MKIKHDIIGSVGAGAWMSVARLEGWSVSMVVWIDSKKQSVAAT